MHTLLEHRLLVVVSFISALYATPVAAPTCESARPVVADPAVRRATIEMTIGGVDESRDAYMFSAISGLAVDGKGQIYVSDEKDNNIRVYSAKGVYAYTIGQKGAGPGDLATPANVTVAPNGQLWVKEQGNHRFSVFVPVAPKGQFVRTIRAEVANVYWGYDRIHWDASGRVVDLKAASPKRGDPTRVMRLFLDSSGTVVRPDTVPPLPQDSVESWTFQTANSSTTYNKPFGGRRLHAFGGRALAAYAINTNYAISLVDPNGKRIALLRRTVTSVPLSAADVKTITEMKEMIAKQQKVTVASLKLAEPKVKPVLASMGFDVDGRLWVERSVAEGQPHEADVYDTTGKWVAIMQWPKDVSLRYHAVSGDAGVAVATDTDGVQRVVTLRFR